MAIQFTAHDHKYQSVNAEESIDWLSVTSFVKLFKEPFDQKEVALKASQNAKSKWYGMDPEHIIKIWNNETDRAVTLGSWYHDQRETEVVMCDTIRRAGMDLPIIRPIEQNGVKIAPDQNLTEGIYPEHMVYLKSAGICGQADRVEVIKDVIDLYDYKTNKAINLTSYVNWEGISKKMLGPLAHLDDCNFNHYALQLSTYMYIMLKHNHYLKPGKMQIHHVKFKVEGEDEFGYPVAALDPNGDPIVHEVIPYDIPFLKSEVREMIKFIKQNPDVVKRGHI
jgi:hypothetical protein